MTRTAIRFLALLAASLLLTSSPPVQAEPPCDRYPLGEQKRCNAEAVSEVAQFGLDQLKRRQEGKITAEQHLQENTAFIKRSAEKRLKLLDERMARMAKDPPATK